MTKSIQSNAYQQLLQALNNHALVSITDLSGVITYVNTLFCETSGYSESELLGQDHLIINSGYHTKEFMYEMWRTLSRGDVWQGDICNRSKQGHLYWSATTITPMLDENGKPQHYIAIRREITPLKNTENRLKLLGMALDASIDMVYLTDINGFISYANPALYTFTGAAKEQLLGMNASTLDNINADPKKIVKMRSCLTQGKSWNGRLLSQSNHLCTLATPSDCWINLSITPIRAIDGKLLGYVSIQSDITHRMNNEHIEKQIQEDHTIRLALAEILQQMLPLAERSNQLLIKLFSLKEFNLQAKGLIYIKDPDLNKLIPLTVKDEFNAYHNNHLYTQCEAIALSQKTSIINQCTCNSHAEIHGHYLIPIVATSNTLGVLALYTQTNPIQSVSRLAILNEISELLALALLNDCAQRAIALARDNAELASKSKSEFLANMSHEIRTPMNGVLGMLDVLHQTSLLGYQVEILDVIRDSAFSLLGIIEDVLDFSKIEAGKLDLEQAPFNVREVIEKSATMLNRLAINKDVTLIIYTDPLLPPLVKGDAVRLRQIVVNFINNAIKFSSEQSIPGQVLVRAILIERIAQQAIIEINVIDNGIGMDESTQTKLFSPFTQADTSTTRRFGGTGLGLTIAQNLVHMMDGSIKVQSTLGLGTTFSVLLSFTVLEAPIDNIITPSLIDKLDCLVIGNLKNQAQHFSSYLKAAGASVSHVADLRTAYQQIATARSNPWIWILEKDQTLQLDELQATLENQENVDIRIVMIGHGQRNIARQHNKNHRIVEIDNNILTQQRIVEAVIMAAGRMSTEKPIVPASLKQNSFNPLSREEALKRGRLILVAEDNRTNQNVIQRQLAMIGFAADMTSDGYQALARWRTGQYPLLLTDLHMPKMDGYELAVAIRAEEDPSKPLVIIAWTASILKSEGQNCLSVGMNDIIRKPSSRQDLKTMLEKWLPLNDDLLAIDDANTDNNLPTTPASSLALNIKILENLVGDDPEIIKDFLQEFRSSATTLASSIKAEFYAGEISNMVKHAHILKSSARSVGALKLGDLCDEIEYAGKSNQPITALNEYIQFFNLEMITVEMTLEHLLSNE